MLVEQASQRRATWQTAQPRLKSHVNAAPSFAGRTVKAPAADTDDHGDGAPLFFGRRQDASALVIRPSAGSMMMVVRPGEDLFVA